MTNEYTILGYLRFSAPFIYVVKGTYYLIGKNTMRICTDEEKALYKDFCILYSEIKDKIPYYRDVSAALSETKKLVDATQTIMTLSSYSPIEESDDAITNNIWQLIISCSKETLVEWEQQIQKYFDALRYMSAYEVDMFIQRRNQE